MNIMTSLKVCLVVVIIRETVKQKLYMIRRTQVVQPKVRDTMYGKIIFKKKEKY